MYAGFITEPVLDVNVGATGATVSSVTLPVAVVAVYLFESRADSQ